jgi:ribosome-associated toxin RatA of RatAB toxin-antitoxin module
MRTHIGIEIAAPPRQVFELARQVSRWPEMLPHYRDVTVESREGDRIVARMSAVRPGVLRLPVSWRAEHWADDSDPSDLRLHFRHVGGATRGMEVIWHIRPLGGGAQVVIEHDFSRRLPLVGAELFPRVVDRWFIRPIAGRTLATFKALAERGAS